MFTLARCFFLHLCLIISPSLIVANDEVPAELPEPYPQLLELPSYIYEDYQVAYDRVFSEDAIPYWWTVGLSTAALLALDEQWIAESERLGKKLGIGTKYNTNTVLGYKGIKILSLPEDTGSFMYFIGDGWTTMAFVGGFLATGALTDDDKAYNVGFQLIEGLLATGISTQTIKHITGRQSPNTKTESGGKWDFFPNQSDYFADIANYDAFPSGHLAVGTMTLTVISKNYPEKTWIIPTGITLLSLLSFQMNNNNVHWASDYPVAIALGYTFGSIAYERGQRSLNMPNQNISRLQFQPIVSADGLGVSMHYTF